MPGMLTRALILGLLAIASPAAGGQVSLGEVVAKAEARFEGRVIGAELVDGRREERTDTVYALRLLTPQGAVLNLRFDAASGSFLEAEGRGLSAARKRP
jgi:uncharacterized membrane protein YkoI